jgi:hypothetical protein
MVTCMQWVSLSPPPLSRPLPLSHVFSNTSGASLPYQVSSRFKLSLQHRRPTSRSLMFHLSCPHHEQLLRMWSRVSGACNELCKSSAGLPGKNCKRNSPIGACLVTVWARQLHKPGLVATMTPQYECSHSPWLMCMGKALCQRFPTTS